MLIENDVKLDYSDVLLVPNRSSINSRSEVDLEISFFDNETIPIIAANMDGVGSFEMAKQLAKYKMLTALVKHYTLEELVDYYTDSQNIEAAPYTIYSMGMSDADKKKFEDFNNELDTANHSGVDAYGPNYVCIDVANGYIEQFEKYVAEFATRFPSYVLIVGNVCTPGHTGRLIDAGADIVKIGIGPGSVCTTRRLTGVGYPQFSAVLECAAAAHDAGGMIVADGGITCPGDAAKAFGAGADLIMLGGYLAGHDEGGGVPCDSVGDERFTVAGSHRKFYGMASKEAQHKHNGGVAEYRASEGKEVLVPYRGRVKNTISELLGGIRSACTYCGAESIDQMHRKARFVRVNRQLNNVFGS